MPKRTFPNKLTEEEIDEAMERCRREPCGSDCPAYKEGPAPPVPNKNVHCLLNPYFHSDMGIWRKLCIEGVGADPLLVDLMKAKED